MGNQGFQGDARAQVQSSIVQERNKTAISYLNATNTSVRLRERVLYANLRRDTGVTPSVTSHLSSTARLPGENTLISQDSRVPGSSSAQRRPASTAASLVFRPARSPVYPVDLATQPHLILRGAHSLPRRLLQSFKALSRRREPAPRAPLPSARAREPAL